jgi:TolA-binding protein
MLVMMIVCLAVASGCSSDKKARELFDTAQFEEKQHNREHATRLYEQIIQQYPGTETAKKAEARLGELKDAKP